MKTNYLAPNKIKFLFALTALSIISNAQLQVVSSGKVGIGTSVPNLMLHAVTSDAVTNTVTDVVQLNHVSSGAPAASFGTGLLFTGKSSTTDARNMARIQSAWSTATDATRTSILQFQTLTGAGSLTTQMTINGIGNVGIGQTNPATAKIEILNTAGGFTFRAGMGSTYPSLDIYQVSSGPARTSLLFTNGAFEIYDQTAGASRFFINTTGNIGIWNSTPNSATLMDILAPAGKNALYTTTAHTTANAYHMINYVHRGDTKAFSVQNNSGGSYVENLYMTGAGDIWAKSITQWSDKNFKENIDTIGGALDKVLKLKGVKYNFKASKTGLNDNKMEIGLIAQDVELVVPEVVNTNADGIKGIMYSNLTTLLIEAIKEQTGKINDLQNQLNYCCTSKQQSFKINNNSGSDITAPQLGSDLGADQSRLFQNNPNPFNQQTNIQYFIPATSQNASIMVFDLQGKLVKVIPVTNFGNNSVTIRASKLRAGMFVYSLIVDDKAVDTKRMILTD